MTTPLARRGPAAGRKGPWITKTLGLLSKEAQTALFDLKHKTKSFLYKPKSQDLRAGRSQNHCVPTHKRNLQIASKILGSSSLTHIFVKLRFIEDAYIIANLFPSNLSLTLNLIRTTNSSLVGSKGMHTHTKVNKNTRVCSSLEEISYYISAESSSHWDSNPAWWSLSGKPNLQKIKNSRHYLLVSSKYNSSISKDSSFRWLSNNTNVTK